MVRKILGVVASLLVLTQTGCMFLQDTRSRLEVPAGTTPAATVVCFYIAFAVFLLIVGIGVAGALSLQGTTKEDTTERRAISMGVAGVATLVVLLLIG